MDATGATGGSTDGSPTLRTGRPARKAQLPNLLLQKPWRGIVTGMNVEKMTFAAAANDLAAIRRGAAEGVDLDGHGKKEGWTALHWAAYEKQLPAVQLLLELGARPDVKGNIGDTALHVAVLRIGGDIRIIDALLAAGADRTIENDYGMSPAEIAGNTGGEIGALFERTN